jgi:Dna[CI] antecedent, DciA
MERIGPVGEGAIASLLSRAPLTREKVAFAWRLAVGPAIARATSVELQGTRLDVSVSEGAWAREIRRARDIILQRLRQVLGAHAVSSIELQPADGERLIRQGRFQAAGSQRRPGSATRKP